MMGSSISSEQARLFFPKVASVEAKANAARLQSAFLLASIVGASPEAKAAAETTIKNI